jgi:hypothetical protein
MSSGLVQRRRGGAATESVEDVLGPGSSPTSPAGQLATGGINSSGDAQDGVRRYADEDYDADGEKGDKMSRLTLLEEVLLLGLKDSQVRGS